MNKNRKEGLRIGLLTVSLPAERVDIAKRADKLAYKNFTDTGIRLIHQDKIATSEGDILSAISEFECKDVDCIIYLIGTWIYPPSIVSAIQESRTPCIIWAITEPASFSLVGSHVLHGMLDEMGAKHKLVYGDPQEKEVLKTILAYSRAAMIYKRFKGTRYGLIGGLNLGNYTATADLIQIKSIFGIDTIHIDQMVLIDRARDISDEDCEEIFSTIKNQYGKIDAPKKVMLRSIKIYIAYKEIIEKYKLDFAGIKCLEEVINCYGSCCLAVALANAEGLITACQSDINASIMMQILHLLSIGPVGFGDVVTIDRSEKMITIANCGSMSANLAAELSDVEWGYQYEYMGESRGATASFCCKPGVVTMAALGRIKGRYVMNICNGEVVKKGREALSKVRDIWPQAFIKVSLDIEKFIQNVRTGHSLFCYGDYVKELEDLCEILGIERNTYEQPS
ncbi:MAG: hypothetical protein JXQ30_04870 [Spirochaetes bacterium]|nr:hypothetical protein [Spirochaetota bacterium]